jgi:hypothetical protein
MSPSTRGLGASPRDVSRVQAMLGIPRFHRRARNRLGDYLAPDRVTNRVFASKNVNSSRITLSRDRVLTEARRAALEACYEAVKNVENGHERERDAGRRRCVIPALVSSGKRKAERKTQEEVKIVHATELRMWFLVSSLSRGMNRGRVSLANF